MLVLGWWLLPIALYRLVPLSLDAQAWRQLLPASSRPDVFSVIWMRWIRESVNALLPVAGVGGDIASARLVHRRGVPGAKVAAAMVVDITVGVATQLIFVLSGVTLLAARSNAHAAVPVAWAMLTGIAVFVRSAPWKSPRSRPPRKAVKTGVAEDAGEPISAAGSRGSDGRQRLHVAVARTRRWRRAAVTGSRRGVRHCGKARHLGQRMANAHPSPGPKSLLPILGRQYGERNLWFESISLHQASLFELRGFGP